MNIVKNVIVALIGGLVGWFLHNPVGKETVLVKPGPEKIVEVIKTVAQKCVPEKQVVYIDRATQKEIQVASNNRVRLLAGTAPRPVSISQPSSSSVDVRYGQTFAAGIGYERRLFDSRWSLGAEVLTNGSVLGTLSLDF